MAKLNREKNKLPLNKKIVTIIVNIVLWVLFGVLVFGVFSIFIQRVSGNTPNLFGYKYYFVLTGSMKPDLLPGDIILTKTYNITKNKPEIKEGDVVTYLAPEGHDLAGRTITHKVIKEPYLDDVKGKYYIVTKGVANYIADDPIPIENVQAIMVKKLPLMGKLYQTFLKDKLLLIVLFAIVFLSLSSSIVYGQVTKYKKKVADASKKPPEDEEFKEKVIQEYLEKKKKDD